MTDEVSVWCIILKEREGAIMIHADDGRRVWLPRSQITEMPGPHKEGDTVLIRITEWIAMNKGLI